MAVQNKDITYISKDFNDIRSQLINFSQYLFKAWDSNGKKFISKLLLD